MFLRSLTIKGFKSFADPVTIDLSSGVSVIVGPNGSGKSNIADAIAWVLGAQGPKTVRSSKMDDVIFSGAGKRGPLGRAEVSIVFDNSDGGLQLDLPEVTVTRTLFRSGESEYSLNGNPCRLIDLQDILSDAGVGHQQHIIISQGQLDTILNAKPEERREVVEEAAGITKFKKRRERTERRLASMEGDLARAEDLVREVRRQIRPLAQQAAKAKHQLEIRDRLAALKRYLAGAEMRALESIAEDAVHGRVEAELALFEAQNEISSIDQVIAVWESRESQVSADNLFDLTTRGEALFERLKSVLSLAQQKRQSLEERLKASDRSRAVASIRSELDSLNVELVGIESEIVELGSELSYLEEEEKSFRLEETPEIAEELQALNSRFSDVASENSRLHSRRNSLAETAERIASQLHELELRRAKLTSQLVAKSAEHDQVQDRLTQLGGLCGQIESQHAESSAAEMSIKAQLEDALAGNIAGEVVVNSLRAKVSAYEVAIDEGRSRTQAEALRPLSGFIGALVDVIEIKSGYERAFSAALQGLATSVLAKDLDSALDGLRHLKTKNLEGSIIPISHFASGVGFGGGKPPADAEPLREHILTTGAKLSDFLDEILRHTYVVRGALEEAIELHESFPGLVFVTLQGERLGPDGLWTALRPMQATGVALERALAELEIAESEQVLKATEVARLQAVQEDAAGKCEILRNQLENLRKEHAGLKVLPGRIAEDVGRLVAEVESLDAEQSALGDRAHSVSAELEELDFNLGKSDNLILSFKAEIGELQRKMKEQYSKRRELDQKGADLELRAAKLEQARLGLERSRESSALRMAQELEIQASMQKDLASWNRAAIGLFHVIADASRLESWASGVLEELRRDRIQLLNEARLKSEKLSEARSKRSRLEAELNDRREALQVFTVRQSEARVRLETIGERIRRDLGIEVEIAKNTPVPEGVHPSEAEFLLRQLEDELSRLGPVNELAELELSELTEKKQFLESQLEDVNASRRELGKVIQSIDSEMLQIFRSAVSDVAENFSILFEQLFQGGKGRLVMTDPNEPMKSGLDVEATLPGKSIKRLSLLSGGERSLISLAFLFSVFESRPSPFYILDEVEAALDDINLNRFLRLITSFGKSSQLLIISHQKRTMEVADLLYGVTMEQGGSTKVVSQRMAAIGANLE